MHLCIQPTPSLFAFIVNFHRLAAIYGQFVVPLWVLTLAWKYFYSGAGEEKQGRGMGNKITDRSTTPTEVSSPPLLATGGEDDCPSIADDDHNKPTFPLIGLFLDALQSDELTAAPSSNGWTSLAFWEACAHIRKVRIFVSVVQLWLITSWQGLA